VCAVDHDVNEEEPIEEFAKLYRKQDPKNSYREQELLEGFEDHKSNLILGCIFDLVLQTQPIGLFSKLHIVLLLKHSWMATL